jgi:uncharacterized protein YbcC (UPF0753/DUF2309 family)
MLMQHETYPAALLELVSSAEKSARMIPPLFPLTSSVAVNPFLGQTGEPLAQTAARMARVAGISVTPKRAHFAKRIADGQITDVDLSDALEAAPAWARPADLATLKDAVTRAAPAPVALPTVAQLAAEVSGIDWPGIVTDRIGVWAASYFDQGQALWRAPQGRDAYVAWRAFATRDLTPEILGLSGFAAHVDGTSRSAWRAMGRASETLGLGTDAAPSAFHRLLMDLGGWAQYARYQLWQAELKSGRVNTVTDLLTVRLVWEEALYQFYEPQIAARWAETVARHVAPVTPNADQVIDAILQDATERSVARSLTRTFAAKPAQTTHARPTVQAAFCIDVRSEVFRRALEATSPEIETLGFAGFFGLTASHKPSASDVAEARGPVLLPAGPATVATEPADDDNAKRYVARANRAWGRFKLAAVSSFAFVEATGPIYAGKLLKDTLGLSGSSPTAEPAPRFDTAMDVEARAATAATILKAMSLTQNFAKIVLVAGHGAHVTNNAHASALQCGACGGYSGEVNARLLAGLLNDPATRLALTEQGIDVPSDTLFVPALHDTTRDKVTLYDVDTKVSHATELAQLRRWLDAAGALTRGERAARLPRATGATDVARRSADWAELRPEWGLAGCRAFVVAPRSRTSGADLGGQAFLHTYDWRADDGFGVLELIMTAPVVVASWISLQYYGSTVAPEIFGGGNKLLHNVTGGIGVVEGNGGALRAGLPWQSVHDGDTLMHDPLRLSVVIEAPRSAICDILGRHPDLKALFDNGWLNLFALDDNGLLAWRYRGDLEWSEMPSVLPQNTAIAAE